MQSKDENKQLRRCYMSWQAKSDLWGGLEQFLPAAEIQSKGNTIQSSHRKYSINKDKRLHQPPSQ